MVAKKKLLLLVTIFLALSCILPLNSFAQGNKELPYIYVGELSEGLALYEDVVDEEYLYGYLDKNGEVVIPAQFEYAYSFSDGLAAVYTNGAYGYINRTGEFVIPPTYSYAEPFQEGFASVTTNDYNTYIDKNGTELVKLQLDFPGDNTAFSNGMAAVVKNDKWGFYNSSGQLVIPHQYISTHGFQEDLAAVFVKDNEWTYINKEGKRPFNKVFNYVQSFSDGLAPVMLNDKWGFINKKGDLVIPAKFDGAHEFSEGIAAVRKGLDWGFIDKLGNFVISPKYEDVYYDFYDGIALVSSNYEQVYIGKRGQVVLPYNHYANDMPFTEGYVILQNFESYTYTMIQNPLYNPPSSWATNEVSSSMELSLVPEDMQNSYTATISRQEFSRLMVELAMASGLSMPMQVNSNPFKDTDDTHVLTAYQLGFISGKGNGIFDPHGSITRQEAALMLKNVGTQIGISGGKGLTFADQNKIASWAQGGVSYVSSVLDKTNNYPVMATTGENKFSPTGNYTREQAYITVKRLFNAK